MPTSDIPGGSRRATVDTSCPLDCPDGCTVTATVEKGRLVSLDGGTTNPTTKGYICAKVRRFGDRVYGDARLRYPAVRRGVKGQGLFSRVTWDEALDLIAAKIRTTRDDWGAEAILPYCYGGSNGFVSQDAVDAQFFRRLGTSRLARTLCAAPTGAANQLLYGKMPSVTYEDYPEAKLIVLWGVNPSTSGIHLVPYVREAQQRGARLVVIDPRATQLARQADLHLAVRPGTDVAVALAIHHYLFARGHADLAFLGEHATGVDVLRARAAEWPLERAAETAGIAPALLERLAEWYATSTPALIRCGWGLERNRNGGNGALAVLSLPAVGGKFGVRGGGYSMSNSPSWSIERPWIAADEPPTRIVNMNQLGRALAELDTPPIKLLFVYNCNPVATVPDHHRVIRGLEREDLFTVVFEQVMTDTAYFADVVLPATTFLEAYDFARSYGPICLQISRPIIDAVGEARPNPDVFADLCRRLELRKDGEPEDEIETFVSILGMLPEHIRGPLGEGRAPEPPFGSRPIQFVDVYPRTPDRKVHLYSAALDADTPQGLYRYQSDPATERYPLTLISPSSDRTISSTLGELPRPEVRLQMHGEDATPRGLREGDTVRVFNELGEIRCRVNVTPAIRPGTVSLPKGLWRKDTMNGVCTTALAPDGLSDLGGGACFNDARVQVALWPNA